MRGGRQAVVAASVAGVGFSAHVWLEVCDCEASV